MLVSPRSMAVGVTFALVLCAAPAMADPTSTQIGPARGRIYAPDKPCSAVQAAVERDGSVIVAESDFVYETVYRDSGACRNEVTSAPAYTATLDARYCFAGYRCKERSQGDNPR